MATLTLSCLLFTSLCLSAKVTTAADFIPVGCYRDKHSPNARPLPELIANYRNGGVMDWHNLYSTVVVPCAKAALDKGYEYFGVQFYGECWSGPNGHETFNIDGPSDNCWEDVGKNFALLVYKKITTETECVNYKNLNEPNRAVTSAGGPLCDYSLESGPNTWYRFTGQAGTSMANTCTYKQHCGTLHTGWLQETPPTVQEGIVSRKVCFSSRTASNSGNCCADHGYIKVRNCGKFYVYNNLKESIKGCPMRYCGHQSSPLSGLEN